VQLSTSVVPEAVEGVDRLQRSGDGDSGQPFVDDELLRLSDRNCAAVVICAASVGDAPVSAASLARVRKRRMDSLFRLQLCGGHRHASIKEAV
jgi:hypothetical protein